MGGCAVYYRGTWEATFTTRRLAEAYVAIMSKHGGRRAEHFELQDVI